MKPPARKTRSGISPDTTTECIEIQKALLRFSNNLGRPIRSVRLRVSLDPPPRVAPVIKALSTGMQHLMPLELLRDTADTESPEILSRGRELV